MEIRREIVEINKLEFSLAILRGEYNFLLETKLEETFMKETRLTLTLFIKVYRLKRVKINLVNTYIFISFKL